jgi:hypothetical protein
MYSIKSRDLRSTERESSLQSLLRRQGEAHVYKIEVVLFIPDWIATCILIAVHHFYSPLIMFQTI